MNIYRNKCSRCRLRGKAQEGTVPRTPILWQIQGPGGATDAATDDIAKAAPCLRSIAVILTPASLTLHEKSPKPRPLSSTS